MTMLFALFNAFVLDASLLISPDHTQVGHVQPVSLTPHRMHEMKTISLKPLIFGKCTSLWIWCLFYELAFHRNSEQIYFSLKGI